MSNARKMTNGLKMLNQLNDHLSTGEPRSEIPEGLAAVHVAAQSPDSTDEEMIAELAVTAKAKGLDIEGGKVRRTSSRFCLGVEHGDYNGTELFGVGTDRFIWLACEPFSRCHPPSATACCRAALLPADRR